MHWSLDGRGVNKDVLFLTFFFLKVGQMIACLYMFRNELEERGKLVL